MNIVARMAIAAAAVVVVAIAGDNLLPRDSGTGGPNPTPTAGPTEQPSPSPSPAMTFPALLSTQQNGAALAPGDWIITAVEPLSITISIPEGWYKGHLNWAVFPNLETFPSVGFMAVNNVFVDPCDQRKGYVETELGPTVDDLVAAMSAVPGIQASDLTDVTINGYNGKYLVLSKPAADDPCLPGRDPTLWLMDLESAPAPGPGDDNRYWVLDVEGTRLIVSILGTQAAQTLATEAQAIVDSIRIEP
jgi:hypothetical protein